MRRIHFKNWLLLGSFGAYGLVFSQPAPSALQQADTDYRAGLTALASNNLKKAQEEFEAVVRLEPGLEQGHSALGAVLVREGQWAAGIRELESALAIKPSDDAAQLNLAIAYAESGAHAKALPLFARAEAAAHARGSKLPAEVIVLYAKSLAAAGHGESAIAHMKEAAAEAGASAQIHDDLGSLYAQRQDWPHAEEEFNQALRTQPAFAEAHLHLGFVLQAEQKGDPAAEWVEAGSLAPDNPQILLQAGKALADAGQDDKAAPILEQSLHLDPRSSAAQYALALVYQRSNRVSDAVDLLKKVVVAEPKNTAALINLGLALSQLHRAQEALPYLQRAIALDSNDLTAHQDLAAAYIQVDQVANAVTELGAALALAPGSPRAHYDLGVAYKLQDDAADAIPQLEAAEKLDPGGYEAPYVLGLLYNQVARYSEAAQQLEASLKLQGQNGDGWSALGSVYFKLDKLPEATSALRNAIQQLPGQSDPHLLLANVLIKQGNTTEAAQERKTAADLMRAHMNRQRAEVATNSGKSLLTAGKVDDAIVEFRNALTFDANFAEAHRGLADALDKEGKTQEAKAERAQAKALDAEGGESGSAP
jgi:tetratricopeptide (TPR) repeat protein